MGVPDEMLCCTLVLSVIMVMEERMKWGWENVGRKSINIVMRTRILAAIEFHVGLPEF